MMQLMHWTSKGWLALSLFFAGCEWVLAHPGHGTTSPETPVHYLVEPTHNWWLLAALTMGPPAALLVRRRWKPAPVRKRSGRRSIN